MRLFMPNLKFDADPENTGGVGGYDSVPTKPETKTPDATPTITAAEATGDNSDHDDYGYKKVPDAGAKKEDKPEEKAAEKKPEEKPEKKADEEIKDPATGYGDDDKSEKKPDEKPEEKPSESAEDTTPELGFQVKLDGFEKTEAESIKSFVKENKVPKEIVEKYLELRKADIAAMKKAQEDSATAATKAAKEARDQQRENWKQELKKDPTFGGEKFGFNLKQTEKVLNDLMPNTKKALTDKGGMLPPYVMRDLLSIARREYGTDSLVTGDAGSPKEEAQEDDGTEFYKQG